MATARSPFPSPLKSPTATDLGLVPTLKFTGGVKTPQFSALWIVVGSLALLLPVLISPPPETFAMLVTVNGALLATLTVSTTGGQISPAARASLRLQVSVPSVHVHPVPLIAVAVRASGSASVTVTVPLVDNSPMFFTAMVYDFPVSPCVKLPICVFVTVRS